MQEFCDAMTCLHHRTALSFLAQHGLVLERSRLGAYLEMTVEEVRRVFCFVSQTVRRTLRKLVGQIRHRQRRNRIARLSRWEKRLGRRATPAREREHGN